MAINTDDYDIYHPERSEGSAPEALPGTPGVDENGHLIIPSEPFFSPSTIENSTMDKDPRNTGPTTDFWSNFPLSIDVNGFIFYYDENTGINVRGPEGAPRYVRFSDLTPEDLATLKGQDGANGRDGVDGQDGQDGADGLDAYHAWLRDNGWLEQDHPISEFYTYLASFAETLFQTGNGNGSIIGNYGGSANTANGAGSFAIGYGTAANATNSFSAGLQTQANAAAQAVVGKYNIGNSANVFEVGNGTVSQRKNALEVLWNGDIKAGNNVIDGNGDVLHNKVDKVAGKDLSTNDFNNTYKDFLDNYHIDDTVTQNSSNPVKSSGIYAALENLAETISAKPDIDQSSDNIDYPLLSYESNSVPAHLDTGIIFTGLTYNPSKNNLAAGDVSTIYNQNLMFGQGIIAASNNQIILGKYNTAVTDDLVQIGFGANTSNRKNLLRLTKSGNLIIFGDITDGSGNTLSGKQNTLSYDVIPTEDSTNVMTSGAIWDTLTDLGIVPGQGITIPQLTDIQTTITNIQSQITSLSTQIQGIISSLYYITDDVTRDTYKLGINNGELYIQNQTDPPTSESEENNGEEESET